jgi:hypothetical protein
VSLIYINNIALVFLHFDKLTMLVLNTTCVYGSLRFDDIMVDAFAANVLITLLLLLLTDFVIAFAFPSSCYMIRLPLGLSVFIRPTSLCCF